MQEVFKITHTQEFLKPWLQVVKYFSHVATIKWSWLYYFREPNIWYLHVKDLSSINCTLSHWSLFSKQSAQDIFRNMIWYPCLQRGTWLTEMILQMNMSLDVPSQLFCWFIIILEKVTWFHLLRRLFNVLICLKFGYLDIMWVPDMQSRERIMSPNTKEGFKLQYLFYCNLSFCKVTKVFILELMKKVIVSFFPSKSSNWRMSHTKFEGKWKLKMFFLVFLGGVKRDCLFFFLFSIYFVM